MTTWNYETNFLRWKYATHVDVLSHAANVIGQQHRRTPLLYRLFPIGWRDHRQSKTRSRIRDHRHCDFERSFFGHPVARIPADGVYSSRILFACAWRCQLKNKGSTLLRCGEAFSRTDVTRESYQPMFSCRLSVTGISPLPFPWLSLQHYLDSSTQAETCNYSLHILLQAHE